MDLEKVLSMVGGCGETSYAANSKVQVVVFYTTALFPTF